MKTKGNSSTLCFKRKTGVLKTGKKRDTYLREGVKERTTQGYIGNLNSILQLNSFLEKDRSRWYKLFCRTNTRSVKYCTDVKSHYPIETINNRIEKDVLVFKTFPKGTSGYIGVSDRLPTVYPVPFLIIYLMVSLPQNYLFLILLIQRCNPRLVCMNQFHLNQQRVLELIPLLVHHSKDCITIGLKILYV